MKSEAENKYAEKMSPGGSQSNGKDGGEDDPTGRDSSVGRKSRQDATVGETTSHRSNIDRMKVTDLKDKLRRLGLSATGIRLS